MKNLLNKNLHTFLVYTITIMVCSTPLFYFTAKFFYTKDLDELIEYRRDDFTASRLPNFTLADIDMWNSYNEDIQIIPFGTTYTLDKNIEEEHFNKAEGHPIYYRILYHPIEIEGHAYILSSRIPMIEAHDLLGMLVSQYGLLVIILFLSLVVVQRVISKKLWTPFYSTLETIEKFNLEQGEAPSFSHTDISEFAQLNTILHTLITNNLKIYKQQKEFIENASHELQTPLAVFQSQLDILLQQSELTEAQADVIQSLYSVSSRMTRLNKNLLLLAKLDNAQFKETQEMSVNEMLNSLLPYLKELIDNKEFNVCIDEESPLIIYGDKFLFESLINNLIMNAIRHNVDGNGVIGLELKDRTLTVYNTGEHQALDTTKIFRRFSRPSERKRGNGLGLSIIHRICKYHHWDIKYSYNDGIHCFKVTF